MLVGLYFDVSDLFLFVPSLCLLDVVVVFDLRLLEDDVEGVDDPEHVQVEGQREQGAHHDAHGDREHAVVLVLGLCNEGKIVNENKLAFVSKFILQ